MDREIKELKKQIEELKKELEKRPTMEEVEKFVKSYIYNHVPML